MVFGLVIRGSETFVWPTSYATAYTPTSTPRTAGRKHRPVGVIAGVASAAVVAFLLVLALVLHRRRRRHRSTRAPVEVIPSEHDKPVNEPGQPARQMLATDVRGQTMLSYRSSLDAAAARRLEVPARAEPLAWNDAQRGEPSTVGAHPQADTAVVHQQQRAFEKFAPPGPLAPAGEQSEETRTTMRVRAEADSGAAVVQQQLRALEKLVRPEAEVPPSETSAGPSAPADVAVLQGEIHRLRAALLEREGQRGVDEQPPAYH